MWAPWWYKSVHASTGFTPPLKPGSGSGSGMKATTAALTEAQRAVYVEALPYFDFLNSFSVGRDVLDPHKSALSPALVQQYSSTPLPPPPPSNLPNPINPPVVVVGGGSSSSSSRGPRNDNDNDDRRLSDPRNRDILIWVGDRLLPRDAAKVSVFDSAVQGGDAVWEGIR